MGGRRLTILDCTLRDGGYINQWAFSQEDARTLCSAAYRAGIDIFEVGYYSASTAGPLCRRCPPEFLAALKECAPGMTVSCMLEAESAALPIGPPDRTGIHMLRTALNRDRVLSAIPDLCRQKGMGYQVFVQLMGISAYDEVSLLRVTEHIEKAQCADGICLADSYGSLLPKQTQRLVGLLREHSSLRIGLHAHNNMQLGLANVLAAIEAGVDQVDVCLNGMGRGGGNVPSELLLGWLETEDPEQYHVLPLLEAAREVLQPLKAAYQWGYSEESMLSGVYGCHPYYTGKLSESIEAPSSSQLLQAASLAAASGTIGYRPSEMEHIVRTILQNDP